MAHHKLMDLLFIVSMKILKFMQRLESFNVQSVGDNHFRFALEEMLAFPCRHITDRCKYIAALSAAVFYRLLGGNTEFLCFNLMIEKRKVCIKKRRVDREVPAKLCCMRGEDRLHGHLVPFD